jgi:hypothetical protein
MKTTFLVALIALMAVISLVVVSAMSTDELDLNLHQIKVNDIDVTNGSIVAGEAGEVVPVSIYFTADENASDVQISAWIQGHRSGAAEEDFRDLISGNDYIGRLSLKLPSDIEPEEEFTLYVRIESDEGNFEQSFRVGMQREPYNADVLFVETDNTIKAGSSTPVDIVVKNLGRHDLEDLVVAVSIPELGISKRAYFGDLTPTDECNDDCNKEDATERRLYLEIPANVKAGVYEMSIQAYNSHTDSLVKKNVAIAGTEQTSSVLVPVTSKGIATGETVTYDLIVTNPGDRLGVYEIIPETVEGLVVTVSQPIVTVQAGDSKTVQVQVTAGNKEGTYAFALDVNSNGQLVQRVSLSANVTGKAITSNVTILTIVLAIVFVVLLIVLIVLLTRKPAKEELEESYY